MTVLAALPPEGWKLFGAGDGAKGHRWYDWQWLPLTKPPAPKWHRWLLGRRCVSEPTERRAYVVFAPQTTTLAEVVRVAGASWVIEQLFEAAKGDVGLDHYEVWSWTGGCRHITLAMWALALLASMQAGAIAVEM